MSDNTKQMNNTSIGDKPSILKKRSSKFSSLISFFSLNKLKRLFSTKNSSFVKPTIVEPPEEQYFETETEICQSLSSISLNETYLPKVAILGCALRPLTSQCSYWEVPDLEYKQLYEKRNTKQYPKEDPFPVLKPLSDKSNFPIFGDIGKSKVSLKAMDVKDEEKLTDEEIEPLGYTQRLKLLKAKADNINESSFIKYEENENSKEKAIVKAGERESVIEKNDNIV